ncbi:MAG: UDP-N-acetylmuramoyl-L-alanyl-D-glutamate--2,6-diaminopimelate ligase [Lentisphaerae bacterium]|nr:UDP-N-acetylmuramoyl-L-alanyl-D-glutamate--2,6-diaminopimelate ligase [Lentisphaerota bacterium]
MKLTDLLRQVEVVTRTAPDTLEVTGVSCDSRQTRAGDLFVAISGTRDEGYRHIEQAVGRGAVAIASERPPPPTGPLWIQLTHARAALARMACTIHQNPSHTLAVYGVTGTNGKTTVAGLFRDALQDAGRKTGLISTVEYAYGERVIAATRTTPDSCELQGLLASMRGDGCTAAVMEVSSHALDQHRTGSMRFAGAAFTNLTRDHLDYHQDFESYFTAKRRLFEQMAEENPGAPAVINRDDPYGARLLDDAARLGLRPISYSLEGEADIRAADLMLDAQGSHFTLVTPAGEVRLEAALLGRYNVANVLCVTGLALGAGIPLESVTGTLRRARPRWGRLEKIETPHPASIFVDYAHTDDALANVLRTLREIAPRRLIVVFGCGGDRDRAKRPLMGRVAATLADQAIVTTDNPRTEDPLAIIAEITAGMEGHDFIVEPDRRAAIARALEIAKAGDIVLIAGKGHETYQEANHRVTAFDDRAEARSLAANVR